MQKLDDVFLTPLKILKSDKGSVLHGMKASGAGFKGFGEAYFSTIEKGCIKGWKKHMEMTLNLVVPQGIVRFVVFDDREESPSFNCFKEFILSKENYQRLTVPPGLWVAFQGLSDDCNMLLNIASIEHDPNESVNRSIEQIYYCW